VSCFRFQKTPYLGVRETGSSSHTLAMINDLGQVTNLKLSAKVATGSW
jgi:hypothetical protein